MCLDLYRLQNVHFLCLVSTEWDLSTAKQSNKCWLLTGLEFMSRQSWIFYFSMQEHVPRAVPTTREPLQTGLVVDSIPPSACFIVYSMLFTVALTGLRLPVIVMRRHFFGFHIRERTFYLHSGNMSKIHPCLFLSCGVALDFKASTSPCTHCFCHLPCKQMGRHRG